MLIDIAVDRTAKSKTHLPIPQDGDLSLGLSILLKAMKQTFEKLTAQALVVFIFIIVVIRSRAI